MSRNTNGLETGAESLYFRLIPVLENTVQEKITVVGVDLGKTWIQICGQDATGKVRLTGKHKPARFKEVMALSIPVENSPEVPVENSPPVDTSNGSLIALFG